MVKGDTSMKKIALILTTMAFVLAWGSAYSMEMKGEKIAGLDNGVTVFTSGPDTYDRSSANPAEIYGDLNNGSTVFAVGRVDFDSAPAFGGAAELSVTGSAAGGPRMEGPALELHNGITIFDEVPAIYDTN